MTNPKKHIIDSPIVPSFYDSHKAGKEVEAERLQSVASKIANPISIEVLSPILKKGTRVLDIGAGADASLGHSLTQEHGCSYVAIEPNGQFVRLLQESGIDARRGDVADMPVDSNSINAVHMRFLFGWLNPEQRKAALTNAVRVLKAGEQTSISVIDYDWLMTEGPEEYVEAVAVACDILKSFGFDYEYGSRLSAELGSLVTDCINGDTVEYALEPHQVFEVSLALGSGGKAMLRENANSLIEGLAQQGDSERIDAIEKAMERLERVDDDVEIMLPGIVAQTVSIRKKVNSSDVSENTFIVGSIDSDVENSRRDMYSTSVPDVMMVVPHSPTDDYVRRMQAREYLKAGLLTSEAMIDESGMLCEESYPKKYLDRSRLFVSLPSGASRPAAAVRLIETDHLEDRTTQLRTLPTAEHLNLEIEDSNVFPTGADPSGVIEISAFIRNSEADGTLLDMARVIIGAAADAKNRGHHTGLMTTQEKAFTLIKRLFGEDNFKVIKGPHKSIVPGASDTVDYVSLSVDVQTFLEGVRRHAEQKGRASGILKDIHGIVGAACEPHVHDTHAFMYPLGD